MKIRIDQKDILFEDDNYIAINKKSGWPVHQTLDPSRPNLFNSLKSYLKQRDPHHKDQYLALHHRLDKDTSGIIIFAKSKRANPILSKLFSDRKATKKYLAICLGTCPEEEGTVENFLKKEKVNGKELNLEVHSGGQKAITKYKVIEQDDQHALIEFELITGRMHQIRSHCQKLNLPILGDKLYGDNNDCFPRLYLHASKLHFFDPLSQSDILIKSNPNFSLQELKVSQSKEHELTYIIFNKPYNVLSQFTKQNKDEKSLGDYNLPKDIYPVGRLDKDSEGLLLLTNDGKLNNKIASPAENKEKTYLVQVERIPDQAALTQLRKGVTIKGNYKTRPCKVKILEGFDLPPRNPPIRERKNIPTCWLEIKISEGKNRQVRKMTAAIGHPTLRLIRQAIGKVQLPANLGPGEYKAIKKSQFQL
jgi:RluA family pseudouridine synthase/pseudouridine synthase